MAKKSTLLKIKLNEIANEGEDFHFDRKGGELNHHLEDILQGGDYEVKFTIRPMGNAFEIRGQFWADMALVCSRCALDFKQKVSEKFHEILVIENELPRNGKLAKPNHTTELLNEGPFFSEVRSNTFDISEFLHEIIALAEPLSPTGKPNCDDSCEFYQQAIKEGWLSPEAEPTANQPFKVLDQLKSSQ